MNKVILIGRLASKAYRGVTASNQEYSRFTVVVSRQYTQPNGEQILDFVPCVAWRNNAQFINKYLDKGALISVEGSFQSSRITDASGQINYSYVVNADHVETLETREVAEARRKAKETSVPNPNSNFNNSNSVDQISNQNNNNSLNEEAKIDDILDQLDW